MNPNRSRPRKKRSTGRPNQLPIWSRRRSLWALLLAGLGILGVRVAPASGARFSRVVLDPGHGGKDGGSKWYGVTEKDLTLDVAQRVQRLLQAKGMPTVLTRTSDVFVELDDRAIKANKYSDVVFVSIHFNAHRDRSIKGIETFYYPGSNDGKALASAIQKELGSRIRSTDRGVKPAKLKVLRLTKGTAALVECGFISNRWECQRCATTWFRQILAEEIAEGILNYR